MAERDGCKIRLAARSAADAFEKLPPSTRISLESIQSFISDIRGRPIRVVEFADLVNDTVCGLWLVTDETDIILHAPSSSPLYAQQIILHELAHMILRHDQGPAIVASASLLPEMPNTTVKRMLAREHFDDDTELAAEILADLLASSIRTSTAPRTAFSRVFG